MSHTLIVLPDDSAAPLIAAIRGARRSLNIRMFLFTDPTLLHEVIAASARGVRIRIMLNPARRDGTGENADSRRALEEAKIEVRDSSPAFDLTHQKSMVIDDIVGVIESLNWETRNLTETRDYAVVTSEQNEIDDMIACFNADWERTTFEPDENTRLLWCPNNGRERIARLIDETKKELWLQNERYQDTVIIERLVRAVKRGVKVHVMARPPHKLKIDKMVEGVGGLRILADVGAKVHRMKDLKLHAKTLLADGKRAIVGSINLTPGSFDSRRELAIETDDKHVVKRLAKIAEHDWDNSRSLDLSDEGLRKDLKKGNGGGAEKLVLGAPEEAHKKSAD